MLCFLVAVAYLIKEIINLVDEHYESIKLIVDCVSLAVEIYVILHSRKKIFCPDRIIITQFLWEKKNP